MTCDDDPAARVGARFEIHHLLCPSLLLAGWRCECGDIRRHEASASAWSIGRDDERIVYGKR